MAADTYDQKFAFSRLIPADKGYTAVAPDSLYDATRGYGFEPGSKVRLSSDGAFVTADTSFQFSAKVPEGNYRVTVLYGDPKAETVFAVKAETRRIQTPLIHLPAGKLNEWTFTVNVRNAKIDATKSVSLTPREKAAVVLHWDDKLTLEFCGKYPAIGAVEIKKIDDAVTVFLAGDSTVCDQPGEPWAAWGQLLPIYFSPKVAVANYAESGRSLRSFKAEKRWDKLLSVMKPGDYCLIQFGHNDMKEKGDGVGPYTTFSDSLRWAIKAVRDKGGTPVLLTPMHRRKFVGDEIQPTFGDYPDAIRKIANEQGTPLIDLQAMSKPLYEAYGPTESKKLFVHYPANTFPNQEKPLADDTHFNAFGADQIARCVIEGLRAAKLPIVDDLQPWIPTFDPAHPGDPAKFDIPPSNFGAIEKPAGS